MDVNIDKRAKASSVEKRMLTAENARRMATGQTPYTSWTTYQASQDALAEERSLMKENERPKLPEDEIFCP